MQKRQRRHDLSTHLLLADRAAEWRAAGLSDWQPFFGASLDNARQWRDAADWTPAEAAAYRKALVEYYGATEAAQFRALGFTPDEAQAWAKSGHGPDLAAQERAAGKQPRRHAHGIMRTR